MPRNEIEAGRPCPVHRRVLWLIRGLGPGGAEQLLVAQARASRSGVRYEVAYQVAAKDQLVAALEAAGVTVHFIGGGAGWVGRLRSLVRERGIDVVHSQSPVMAVGARLGLRALPGSSRPALVYTEHNRWGAYRLPTRVANALTFALDDHVLAVSTEARSSVVRPLRGRVQALHHGVDGESVRSAAGDRVATRATMRVGDNQVLALQVANFRPEKAHDVLLATARLLADEGSPVRFLLAGQGPLQAEVEQAITDQGLGSTVQVLGFRSDVAALIAAADVTVLSSDHEGLPVAVMESLALGTPLVATAVGGIPEAIEDGVEGLLVPPRDPAALAAALRQVAADPDLRARLAAGAAARAGDFDARTATEAIEQIYADVAETRATRKRTAKH